MLEPMLANGVSVVSISFGFMPEAEADNLEPPVKGPMTDATRVIQKVLSKAAEWHIDKRRIAAGGVRTSPWLAFHDDTPDPKSVFLEPRKILPWIQEYSPYALITPDDPPIHLWYRRAPAVGEKQEDPTHSANFGVKLKERLDEVGVRCELSHGGNTDDKPIGANDFLFLVLGATR